MSTRVTCDKCGSPVIPEPFGECRYRVFGRIGIEVEVKIQRFYGMSDVDLCRKCRFALEELVRQWLTTGTEAK